MKQKFLTTFALLPLALCIPSFAGTSEQTTLSGDTVLVEINGVKVTLAEFERERPTGLFSARNKFYDAEKKAILAYVDQYLLEQQAKKEGLTVEQLLAKHVSATLPPEPSEESLRVYYEGIDTTEPFEAVRSQILDRIHQGRYDKAKAAYMLQIHNQSKVSIVLPVPRGYVSLKDSPLRGNPNAPITIVEYADYECPYCQQEEPIVAKMLADNKDRVAFVYKDVPLPMHAHAEKASEAAHCAAEQGKYWEFHDKLYNSKILDFAHLKEMAHDLKLDEAAFDKCVETGHTTELVKNQINEGRGLGMEGTPTFLINGRFFNGGMTYEEFQRVINEELKHQAAGSETAQAR